MASDKVLTCANDPNFAIICTFFHKFAKQLNLGHPNIQLLQEWLENTEEVSPGLKLLHIKLLRKLRKIVHETAWETALSKFCWFYSAQDAWEIERFGYKKSSLKVKLRVLRELIESQFERNSKFRTITQTMTADELRSEPIGRDKLGHSYWLAQDPDCNLRVYQEHLDEEIWQVVATNREELITLIKRLRGNEVVLPSLVGAIDEDSSSNSCSAAVIKPPPPEERDESQDDDIPLKNINKDNNSKLNANDDNGENDRKVEEKIPNIKIKFDKIVDNNNVGNGSVGNGKIVSNNVKTDEKIENNKNDDEESVDDEEDEVGEEDEEEEEVDDDFDESEDETQKVKNTKIVKKLIVKNDKKESPKKSTPKKNDSDRKVKPLIISQSKISTSTTNSSKLHASDKSPTAAGNTSYQSAKKRTITDVEPGEIKENEELIVKKPRPTLLDAKREKNISKYEKFKDDSEDDDDEEGNEDEEEGEEEEDDEDEEDEEEGEEEEEEEGESEDDSEVGEAIQEKTLIVKGEGSGKDCRSSFSDLPGEKVNVNNEENYESFVASETIEENVFFVYGEGSGANCLVGNPQNDKDTEQSTTSSSETTITTTPKATFYFGQPGCLNLSPVKPKLPISNDKDDCEGNSAGTENLPTTSSTNKLSNEKCMKEIDIKNGSNENDCIDDNEKNDESIKEEEKSEEKNQLKEAVCSDKISKPSNLELTETNENIVSSRTESIVCSETVENEMQIVDKNESCITDNQQKKISINTTTSAISETQNFSENQSNLQACNESKDSLVVQEQKNIPEILITPISTKSGVAAALIEEKSGNDEQTNDGENSLMKKNEKIKNDSENVIKTFVEKTKPAVDDRDVSNVIKKDSSKVSNKDQDEIVGDSKTKSNIVNDLCDEKTKITLINEISVKNSSKSKQPMITTEKSNTEGEEELKSIKDESSKKVLKNVESEDNSRSTENSSKIEKQTTEAEKISDQSSKTENDLKSIEKKAISIKNEESELMKTNVDIQSINSNKTIEKTTDKSAVESCSGNLKRTLALKTKNTMTSSSSSESVQKHLKLNSLAVKDSLKCTSKAEKNYESSKSKEITNVTILNQNRSKLIEGATQINNNSKDEDSKGSKIPEPIEENLQLDETNSSTNKKLVDRKSEIDNSAENTKLIKESIPHRDKVKSVDSIEKAAAPELIEKCQKPENFKSTEQISKTKNIQPEYLTLVETKPINQIATSIKGNVSILSSTKDNLKSDEAVDRNIKEETFQTNSPVKTEKPIKESIKPDNRLYNTLSISNLAKETSSKNSDVINESKPVQQQIINLSDKMNRNEKLDSDHLKSIEKEDIKTETTSTAAATSISISTVPNKLKEHTAKISIKSNFKDNPTNAVVLNVSESTKSIPKTSTNLATSLSLKTSGDSKLVPNRKRRLSPVATVHHRHHVELLPSAEKSRLISESSETDFNSENNTIDEQLINEDDAANEELVTTDVGGKRARFRLKIVNTDLRKKIEEQRKIDGKDNSSGSSSSSDDERIRKKPIQRKSIGKSSNIDDNKLIENFKKKIEKNDDDKIELELNRVEEKLVDSTSKSSVNVKNDKTDLKTNKIDDKLVNKKIAPNKLTDKIEFLKQQQQENLDKNITSSSSSSVITKALEQDLSSSSSTKKPTTESVLFKKRISPKKIEDNIEKLKQNIEKTNQEKSAAVNVSPPPSEIIKKNIDIQETDRPRKRASPPKRVADVFKSPEISEISIKSKSINQTSKSKNNNTESDEEIPRKRTISEESADYKGNILSLNEATKTIIIEGNSSSTDEDRSRKRATVSDDNPSQPVEKSSKNDIVEVPLQLAILKTEPYKNIDDQRPTTKKRSGTVQADQYDRKRSEKFCKVDKPLRRRSSPEKNKSSFANINERYQEQNIPEDLSRKNVDQQKIVTCKNVKQFERTTNIDERPKMKYTQKDNEIIDKKLKLSSTESPIDFKQNSIGSSNPKQQIKISPKSNPGRIIQNSSKTDVKALKATTTTESEEERPRKRTIATEKSPQNDRPLSEIKKEKIDLQSTVMKSIVSPPEKLKIIERNEEKIKIVVKTCSVPEVVAAKGRNAKLTKNNNSEKISPEVSKLSTTTLESKKKLSPTKKSTVENLKKTLDLEEELEFSVINRKESEKESSEEPPSITVAAATKPRNTRRGGGDNEPLIELSLPKAKRRGGKQTVVSQTPQKKPATVSSNLPKGKKQKKDNDGDGDHDDDGENYDYDEKIEFIECKPEKVGRKQRNENQLSKKLVQESPPSKKPLKSANLSTVTSTESKIMPKQQRRKREIDTSNIIETESDVTPMRQSRRIAQLKIREEAERRKLEEIALKKMKEDLKRKKKEEKKQLKDDPTVVIASESSESSEKEDNSDLDLKKKFDKKKKSTNAAGQKKTGWSSGTDEDDHEPDDDDFFKYPPSDHGSPLFKSDHEFSPESDIEDESQVVPLKRARTARKEGEIVNQLTDKNQLIDESCQKCGKSDHPEWILLCDKCDKGYHCSCLSPVLFLIPEGDWFCPPCQQEQLIIALEKHLKDFDELIITKKLEEEERIKNLELEAVKKEKQKELDELAAAAAEAAQNAENEKKKSKTGGSSSAKNRRRKATASDGNSKDSKNESNSSDDNSDDDDGKNESRKKRNDRRNQRRRKKERKTKKKSNGSNNSCRSGGSSSSSSSRGSGGSSKSSKSSASDSDDEPIYKLRKRRQTNISYRFNDYDELINRAIKKDEIHQQQKAAAAEEIYSEEGDEDDEGAGNLGRGKDISTILEADKEEKARQKQKEEEEEIALKIKEEEETSATKKEINEKKNDESIEDKKKIVKKDNNDDDDSGSDFEPLKPKQKFIGGSKKERKKKNRKLNCLDISSEDDGSDEDFRNSSDDEDEDEEDESFSVSSDSDSSLEVYRRRNKKGKKSRRKTSRRAARERRKIRDFVVDNSDDESEEDEKPKSKKKRKQDSDFTETDLDDDDDDDELSEDLDSDDLCDDSTDSEQSGWRPSKRKKQKTAQGQKKKSTTTTGAVGSNKTTVTNAISIGKSPRENIGKDVPKISAAKKKPKRIDDDEKLFKASGIVKKNRQQQISDDDSGSSVSDGAGGRKTRGRRLFYMDDYDDEESSDGGIKPGVKRPDTPPEEREKFIKRQEEIKRMLAEKNAKEGGGSSVGGGSNSNNVVKSSQAATAKVSTKTGAGDSLSAVPLSVIRAAKALDVDYLQRKGGLDETNSAADEDDDEEDDEAAAAAAFGDDLPDDFNPEDMDDEAIAKMMEEEDFSQHNQQQVKNLPAPIDVLKQQQKKLNITPTKVPPPSTSQLQQQLQQQQPTPPQMPTQQQPPPPHQPTSVIQDPVMRKRLPMPTIHPLMRPTQPPPSIATNELSHLPLLQSALTNPIGITPQQLTPGVPMQHHHHHQQQQQQISSLRPHHQQIDTPPVSKPRGRRKKITPLRDPVEKAAAVAAAALGTNNQKVSAPSLPPAHLTHRSSATPPNLSLLPTNLSNKDVSALTSGNLNVAQPPQLYKPPSNSPHPSVITRMPQMPPRQRFPEQGSRFFPGSAAGVLPPNAILTQQHRSPLPPPGSLRHNIMPPMHHQSPMHQRPSFVGGPPPLRPGNPPRPSIRGSGGPPLRGNGPPLRGSGPTTIRHSGVTGPPPIRGPPVPPTTISITTGGPRHPHPPPRQHLPPPFTSEQFPVVGGHRSRHSTTPLNPYRPPLYGSPGYPPAPPSHTGSPYGSYYPPPLGSHSATPPSNSVIVAAAAAVSAAAASAVIQPPRLSIPTSVLHPPIQQQQLQSPSVVVPHSLVSTIRGPPKVTALETFDAKNTSPTPLDLQHQPTTASAAILHSRQNPSAIGNSGDNDEDDDANVANSSATAQSSGPSEFSGLVSYFSSQHDEF